MDQTLISQIPTSPQLASPAVAAVLAQLNARNICWSKRAAPLASNEPGALVRAMVPLTHRLLLMGSLQADTLLRCGGCIAAQRSGGRFPALLAAVISGARPANRPEQPVPAVLPSARCCRPPVVAAFQQYRSLARLFFNLAPRSCKPISTVLCTQHTQPSCLGRPALPLSPAGSAAAGATTPPLGPPPTLETTPQILRASSSSPTACWPASWWPWRG